jgi:AcrR family transcriptional regulator
MANEDSAPVRRAPKQERSRQTVEAVLEAVPIVVKRHGARAVTTNRIAEVAGVSIGSLYQYFPDKQAIFQALHERHVEDVRQRMERAVHECASTSLDAFAQSLMEGLADAHAAEPELHELITAALPESALGFRDALEGTFERVLLHVQEDAGAQAVQRMLFVLPPVVEALVHAVPRPRPPFTVDRAKGEAIRTVLHSLDSCRT